MNLITHHESSIGYRILTGVVQKMKMQRTIVVRRDYLHFIRYRWDAKMSSAVLSSVGKKTTTNAINT